MPSALLFDVGDVLMESNWVVMEELERRTGRSFSGRGALDPDGDPAWRRCIAGEIGMDEYWDQLAQSGGYADRIALWRARGGRPRWAGVRPAAPPFVCARPAPRLNSRPLSNTLCRSAPPG